MNPFLLSYSTFYKAKTTQERNMLFFWISQRNSGSSSGLAMADILDYSEKNHLDYSHSLWSATIHRYATPLSRPWVHHKPWPSPMGQKLHFSLGPGPHSWAESYCRFLGSTVLTCWLYAWMDQSSPCLMIAGLSTEPLNCHHSCPYWTPQGCTLFVQSLSYVHSWIHVPQGATLLLLSPYALCSVTTTSIPILSQLILVWSHWSVWVHQKAKVPAYCEIFSQLKFFKPLIDHL